MHDWVQLLVQRAQNAVEMNTGTIIETQMEYQLILPYLHAVTHTPRVQGTKNALISPLDRDPNRGIHRLDPISTPSVDLIPCSPQLKLLKNIHLRWDNNTVWVTA